MSKSALVISGGGSKGAFAGGDFRHRLGCIFAALDPGRVRFRTEDNEVIVHHVTTIDPVASFNKLIFLAAGMNHDDVDVIWEDNDDFVSEDDERDSEIKDIQFVRNKQT